MRASTSARPAARHAGRVAVLVIALAAIGISASPALGAGTSTLSVTTPYPAVVVTPGDKVSFDLAVKTNQSARVELSLRDVPAGWDASLQGGGFVVDAVETSGNAATDVRLDVTVPDDATGTTHLTVRATALGRTVDLALDVRVSTSGGELTMTTDVPSLKDTATATFTFNLMIHNDTPADATYVVNSTGPTGWTVSTRLTGQSQAASAVVKAGLTGTVTVTAEAPEGTEAGQYPIDVVATVGDEQLEQQLIVEITGSYSLTISTPTEVLSLHGNAGATTSQQLTITNDGSADVTNVIVAATAPTNWKVEFDPEGGTIDTIAAGQTETVTAKVTPSSDAIAGDYKITFRVNSDEAQQSSEEFRFTVETSILWAIVGILLIAAVFGGLWWVFRRYGRR